MTMTAVIIYLLVFIAVMTTISDVKQRIAFCAGMLCVKSVEGIVQDIAGKEAWIQYVSEHWVSGWYTVPIQIFFLILGILILFSLRFMHDKDIDGKAE